MIKRFNTVLDKVCSWISFLGAVFVFLLMFLICSDVFGRWMLGNPIEGTIEIAQNMTAVIVFLMLPWSVHLGQHVRSTMLASMLPARAGNLIVALSYLIGALLFVIVFFYSYDPMIQAAKLGDYEGDTFRFPLTPVWVVLLISSVLCSLQCFIKMIMIIIQNKIEDQEVQL